MRIGRLDLIRYGRFTDVSLPFPRTPSDLHIIYGPNEAGKSTSLAAIEDWLFGIGARSPYNFLHEHASLRIGGVLEHGNASLDVVRRKGNKDTLLTPDGHSLSAKERALDPFLKGITREFFIQMMSLDHERLTVGGREILEAKNEVGQMLFAAGTGLMGLREQLGGLEKAAEELWAPRRASHRKFYVALDALEAADKTQRDQTVTATDWSKLKRTLDEARAAYDNLRQDIEARAAEQRKSSRIRRVYRLINQLADIEREIVSLGEPAALPEDAERQLTAALTSQTSANTQINVFVAQLSQEREARETLRPDETVLAQTEAIERMHQRRIEVQRARGDLPKRRAELATKESALEALAEGLGWGPLSSDAVQARLPPRSSVTAARAVLNQRGECLTARQNAQEALRDAQEQVQELRRELEGKAEPHDASRLAATLSAARGMADLGSRIEAAEREIKGCEAKITARLQALHRPLSEQRLIDMPVPPRAAVEAHRDEVRQLDQRIKECQEPLKAAERAIEQHRQTYDRRAHERQGIAPEALTHARDDRETGWRLIRRRYIDVQEIPEPELTAFVGSSPDLPSAYEGRVQAADTLADHRFENAQAAGEMAALKRQIDDQAEERATLLNTQQDLTRQRAELEDAWRALWTGADLEPLAPEGMLEWLTARAEILALIETRETARCDLSQLNDRETGVKVGIVAELAAVGERVEGLQDRALSIVIEQAAATQRRQDALTKERESLQERIHKGETEVARKAARLEEAEERWTAWQARWTEALTELGLSAQLPTEAVTEQIETLERTRALLGEISQLRRERIEKIEQDLETFATAATELIQATAPDLTGRDPEPTVVELEKRLETAKRIRERKREKDQVIASLEKRLKESEHARDAAEQTLRTLQALAGAADPEQLQEVIRRATRRRQLQIERAEIERQLATDGDGLPLVELQKECIGVDLDQASSREKTVEKELQALQDQLTQASEHRQSARLAFDAVGGDNGAIEAATERQEALASLRNVAERYVRTQTSVTLLRWAIDRFRRERQAPLLKQAGRIFAELTSGSFTGLQVQYDADDRPQLTGIRPDRTAVGTTGMSDGTRDQLYLALRLASVEEYLGSAQPLPLVADDLLVNFDDARATAALRVLAELGKKTQVLFFTHHQHLVEIAKRAIGADLSVVTLMEPTTMEAA